MGGSWTPAERRHLRRLLAGQRRTLTVVGVLLTLSTAAVLSGPALIGWGVDGALDPGGHAQLYVAAALFSGISVLGWVASVAELRRFGRLSERLLQRLREAAFTHLLGRSPAFFEATPSGTLITRLTADVEAVALFFRNGLVPLVTNVVVLVATLLFMVALSPALFAIVFVVVGPVSVGLFTHFLRRSRRAYDQTRVRISEAMDVLSEGVAGIAVVQAFGAEQRQRHAFDTANTAQLESLREANRIGAQFAAIVDFVGVAALVPVLVGGAWLHGEGQVSIGTVVAFVVYVTSVFDPIQQIGQFLGQATSARSAFANVVGLLEADDALDPRRADGVPADATIELDGITFAYPGRTHPVLDGFSLRMAAGQRVALVGPSGAGKSTVAKLAGRAIDPRAGSITLGGVDLRDLDGLRRRIVLVGQHAHVFEGSVIDNVRLARPDAGDAEVRRVVGELVEPRVAAALLDADRGTRTPALSAGQRQVVALARALLLDPDVLILDEATAQVDPVTAAALERVLDATAAGRTTIVVAHRFATAERLDRIVVIDDGRIVDDGPPALLRERDGPYRWLRESPTVTA